MRSEYSPFSVALIDLFASAMMAFLILCFIALPKIFYTTTSRTIVEEVTVEKINSVELVEDKYQSIRQELSKLQMENERLKAELGISSDNQNADLGQWVQYFQGGPFKKWIKLSVFTWKIENGNHVIDAHTTTKFAGESYDVYDVRLTNNKFMFYQDRDDGKAFYDMTKLDNDTYEGTMYLNNKRHIVMKFERLQKSLSK